MNSLDLFDCPITGLKEYRDQVFQLLPTLKSLDGLDRDGQEVESEDEEEEVEEDEEEEEETGLDALLNEDLGSVIY